MADTEPFDPRTVPHTLHKVRPGGGHEIPAAPRVILHINGEGFVEECWIQAPPVGDFDLTEYLRGFNTARQSGYHLRNTSWALVFTPEGFEAVLTSKLTSDSGHQSTGHGEWIIGGFVLSKVVSLFPVVGFTTDD